MSYYEELRAEHADLPDALIHRRESEMLAKACAEVEIRTRQRDYWMEERNKMRAIFDNAQKEIRLMREAFRPLVASIDRHSLDLGCAIIYEKARDALNPADRAPASEQPPAPAGGKP